MTRKVLREYFDYLPDGSVKRLKNHQRRYVNHISRGSLRKDGYRAVKFYGRVLKMHRLVYIWHYGKITGEIDHINGDRSDNRIENLRNVSRTQNNWNAKVRKDNKAGIKGVYWSNSHKIWVGKVQRNGESFTFESKNKSLVVRKVAALRKQLHGRFTRA